MRDLLLKKKNDEEFERRVTVITNQIVDEMKNKIKVNPHKHIMG
jgi:hypothetical protein